MASRLEKKTVSDYDLVTGALGRKRDLPTRQVKIGLSRKLSELRSTQSLVKTVFVSIAALVLLALLVSTNFKSVLAQEGDTPTFTLTSEEATSTQLVSETLLPSETTFEATATPSPEPSSTGSETPSLEFSSTPTETVSLSETPFLLNSETPSSTPTETPTATVAFDCTTFGTEYAELCATVAEDGSVRVIVELNAAAQPLGGLSTSQAAAQQSRILAVQRQLLGELDAASVSGVTEYSFIPYMALEVDGNALALLASAAQVSNIYPDLALAPSLDLSVPRIGAPDVWALGFTGSGQTIAILDTGVQSSHPFLSGKVVSEACYSSDTSWSVSVCPGGYANWGTTAPGSGQNCSSGIQGCDHGTHVAGIAAGDGASFDGVAPEANLIAIQVFSRFQGSDDCGGPQFCALTWYSDVLAGLQRVYALRNTYSIAAANLSLGGQGYSSFCDSVYPAMKAAIDNLRSVGIATTISSGNDGESNKMQFPACISSAISVGATDDSDQVANYSNSDTMLSLLAPGSNINSSVLGGGFASWDGTSMAAPHVAGSWALLKDMDPNLTVSQILGFLQTSGVGITDPLNNLVRRRIQVHHALILASPKPGTPAQLSPSANSAINSTTPTFTWGSSINSNTYTISIFSSLTDPHSGEQTVTVNPGELSYTALPLPEGAHYWRVVGTNIYGLTGNPSPNVKFTIDLTPPVAPVLSLPLNAGLLITNAPKLQWLSSATATQYQVQVATDAGFSNIVLDQNTNLLYHQITAAQALDFVSHYYWRVRALDAAGNPSTWSTVHSFDMDLMSSPTNGAFTTDNTPLLKWLAGAGASEYRVQLDDNSDFSSPISDQTVNTLLFQVGDLSSGVYYWQLSAHNTWGWSSWSPQRSFIVTPAAPAVPALASPANLTITNDSTPNFNWQASAGGDSYEIWIDTANTFAAPRVLEFTGASGVLDHTTGSPLADGIYHWRVRAKNTLGYPGAWSPSRQLTVDTLSPAVPTIVKPANNFNSVGAPAHQWSKPTGAVMFDLQYDDSNVFDSVDYSAQATATSFTPPASAQLSGGFFWRMRARDAAGNVSAWTIPRLVTIAFPALGKPIATLPTNNSLNSSDLHTFTWQALPYASSYDIQISTVSNFSSIMDQQTGLAVTTHGMSGQPDGKYYWRVRGANVGGPGVWSATFSFTQDTFPPLAPTNAKPLDNVVVIGTPTFQWVKPAGATLFHLQIDEFDVGDFASPVYENSVISPTSFKLPLNLEGEFVWQVRARDAAGNWSPWAGPFDLTINPPLPAKPVLAVPANNAFTNNQLPILAWATVTYADSYHVQISQVSNFSSIVEQADNLPIPGYTVQASLAEGKYYWRVRAENAIGGDGAFSTTFAFTVDIQAPPSPTQTLPSDIATVAGTPAFTWTKPVGAAQFRLLIDENGGDFTTSPDFDSGWVNVNSLKPTYAQFNGLGDFDWKVCSRDAAGNSGACSSIRSLHIDPPVTLAPALSSPSANGTTTDNTPSFVWLAVAYGVTYEVQVDNNSNFTSPEATNTSGLLNYTANLLPNAKYYWRVRAINVNSVAGAWSAARSFTIVP